MTKELTERINYAKAVGHDIIMVKDGRYVSGTWDEQARAEKLGYKFVGAVADLWIAANK